DDRVRNSNAIISIQGTHSYDHADSDTVEIITPGSFQNRRGNYVITYNETELEHQGGTTTTTVTVESDTKISVIRSGDIHSHMIFEQGRKHLVYYDTQFGSLVIGVSASRVDTRLGKDGGRIEIDYAIEIDNTVAAENKFRLNIRSSGEKTRRSGVPS
ncbi:DUF1934 domain-containing protein, partial [Oscillospiraceae bacterium OttesenSCG-928-F05]|nr:DUF1934 domain-containing protein [Oscillospiraceae bacterium OttesenSCG-928-F05]